jgi:hypothetical protein
MKILTISIISLASIAGSVLGNDNQANQAKQDRLIFELIQTVNRQEERLNKQEAFKIQAEQKLKQLETNIRAIEAGIFRDQIKHM